MSPAQIRVRCRELSRAENDLPKVKWAAFQEQQRTEERAALRFEQKQARVGEFRRGVMTGTVQRMIDRIGRAVDKQMKEKGGTAFSIIRSTFLNWDGDASGEMSKAEVMGALRMLKLNVSDAEADELVKYYDLEGDGEMKYQPLVEDVTRAAPHFLSHPNTARLKREAQLSTRREDSSARPKEMPRVCELFLKKLKRNLLNIMREKGGTEFSILRTNFLNWDADKSGEIGTKEFQGAMSVLGLRLSEAEARAIVDFYDVEGDGEMKYQPLVEDIVRGTSHFLVHPQTERRPTARTPTTDLALQERLQDEDALFSARPRRRPPNAVVEAFKSRLRQELELQMRASGGTIYSICREAFLLWDGDCSGELNVREFSGAIKKMGMNVSDAEARQIVKYYDLEGDGEMRYQELVEDVVRGVPHFMTHPSYTGRGEGRFDVVSVSADTPAAVRRIEAKIRDAADRSAERAATRISGQDLFYGTCIRFDADNTGRLSRAGLEKALREVRCKLGSVEMKHLVGWYDVGAANVIQYKDIVRSIWHSAPSPSPAPAAREKKMSFQPDALTARAKKAGVLAEKARIERKIKDIVRKEKMLKIKAETQRSARSGRA